MLTRYVYQNGPRTTVLEVVAKANGLDLEVIDSFKKGDSTPDHLKAHPLGKVPAFLGADGFALSEVIAIAIYCMYLPPCVHARACVCLHDTVKQPAFPLL